MTNSSQQQLLVDTDAFCKLGVAGLLQDGVNVLALRIAECGRLASLPYMLKRGKLRNRYGSETSDKLHKLALEIPLAPRPSNDWLNPLTATQNIDPGEAQLLAATGEFKSLLLTGDKRSLQAIKDLPGYAVALSGRVIVLEAILLELCLRLGEESIRARSSPLAEVDMVAKVCFSNPTESPVEALRSYYNDIVASAAPMDLWYPTSLGGV